MAYVMENIAKSMEKTGKIKTKNEELIQKLPDGNTLALIKTWIYMENPEINSINKIDQPIVKQSNQKEENKEEKKKNK